MKPILLTGDDRVPCSVIENETDYIILLPKWVDVDDKDLVEVSW